MNTVTRTDVVFFITVVQVISFVLEFLVKAISPCFGATSYPKSGKARKRRKTSRTD